MKRTQQLLTATTLLAASINLAYADGDEFEPFFEALVMGGIAAVDAGDSSLVITESETDKLVQTNANDWDAWTGQLGIGYVYPLADELATGAVQWFSFINPQLNFYYIGSSEIEGDMYQYQSAALNNLDYTMDFNSARLMFDLGLTIASIEQFSLYALAGAGIAWNKVDFQANPNLNGVACGVMGFDVDTASSNGFAYEFGAGITYAMMDDIAVSLEYLYTGLTDVSIGNDNDMGFVLAGSDFDINTQAVLLGLRFAL